MDNADEARYPQLAHTRWLLAHIPTSAATRVFLLIMNGLESPKKILEDGLDKGVI
jgi:hypothetical protein